MHDQINTSYVLNLLIRTYALNIHSQCGDQLHSRLVDLHDVKATVVEEPVL